MLRPSTEGETTGTVNKKAMIIIMILSGVLVALFVAVVIFSIKASNNQDEEDQVAEYKIKKESARAEYEKSNSELERLNGEVARLQYMLERLQAQAETLDADVKSATAQISDVQSADTRNIIIAGVSVGLSVGLNVWSGLDTYKQYKSVVSLTETENTHKAALNTLLAPIHTTTESYLFYMLYGLTKFTLVKKPIYAASTDGFKHSDLHAALCSGHAQKSRVYHIITDTNYAFGAYLTEWPCEGTSVTDKKAMSYSLNNLGLAPTKTDAIVAKNDPTNFLTLGDSEITISENGVGTVQPGRSFSIPTAFNPSTFYAPTTTFTVSEVLVYSISVHSG